MVNESTNKKIEIKVSSSKIKKERIQAPPSKIIIRKLPPSFTENEFKDAISPVPEYNYFSFVSADKGLGSHSYSRAYINFINPEEILSFRDRFDGYVFVDQKGNEFPALVEYASFQKVPKTNHMKKDIRCGTIDEDPDYVAFLDLLQNPETVSLPQIETLLEEIENAEREIRANNGIMKVKTPLLEFVEQRNAERFRPGDRKRRKEYDRKKAREEEKRRKRDYIKDYRKNEYYTREERDRERAKKKEEEKLKWKERREEKEKIRREKAERYKTDEKQKTKDYNTSERKQSAEHGDENSTANSAYLSKDTSVKEEKAKAPAQRTKRYSEVRKKDEKEKKQREDKHKPLDVEEKNEDSVALTEGPLPPTELETPKETEEEEEDKEEVDEKDTDEKKEKEQEDEEEEVERVEGGEEELEEEEEEEEEEPEQDADKDDEDKLDKNEDDFDDMNREDDKDDKSGKDPRTERRIRNKDRPAMQLYRPGQARLKTRLKSSDEAGNDRNEGDSSSSSGSPVLGVTEEKEKKEKVEQEIKGGKGYAGRGGYDRKIPKYRDPRGSGHHQYWDERESVGHSKFKDDYEVESRSSRGGMRKGYSYHQERESKGKWSGRSRETDSSQFKSLTFRRSTSQE